jgi:integrase
MKSPPKRKGADRVVRRTLADGTVKEYRYAPYRGRAVVARSGDSLAELIAAYQRSPEWTKLAAVTRQNYEIYLRPLQRIGHVRVQDVRRRELLLARDVIASKRGDGAATGFIRAASALFAWAVDRDWIEHNPAHGAIKGLSRGHLQAWTREQADTAQAALPEPLRRVVVLARYTGARRGDLCAMPWSAYDGTVLRFVPHKTKHSSPEPLIIPCHPVLKAELDAWRQGAVAGIASAPILTDPNGHAWEPTLLSHYLPAALVRIGLTNELNVHGLRKLAATELAEAGCSAHEIASITGHSSLSMIQLYTKSANQERLAEAAIVRLSERNYKRKNRQ